MYPIAINAAIKLYIPFSISLLCFLFVFWQSVQCIEKYIKNPQGTRLSLKHTSQINKFPAITICSRSYSKSYNIKRLERCGLRYKKNFKMSCLIKPPSKWVSKFILDSIHCNTVALLSREISWKLRALLAGKYIFNF